ncbi:MAG: endonuclease III [bacterium]|nr:endonuclease III [bacterium]
MGKYNKDYQGNWIHKESFEQKRKRALKVLALLNIAYPKAKIALRYGNTMQLLAAVIMSAQATDKKINEITASLFKKYKTVDDFAGANQKIFEQEIRQAGFYRQKTKSIIESAKIIRDKFNGKIPRTMEEILQLRGVARKTANVVLGNAYGVVEGIAVDTHVRRLAQRIGFSTEDNPVKIEQDLMRLFPKKDWFKLTYVLINHGRAVCAAKNRKCEICPLKNICPSALV